jgi:hypothetical protein
LRAIDRLSYLEPIDEAKQVWCVAWGADHEVIGTLSRRGMPHRARKPGPSEPSWRTWLSSYFCGSGFQSPTACNKRRAEFEKITDPGSILTPSGNSLIPVPPFPGGSVSARGERRQIFSQGCLFLIICGVNADNTFWA